MIKFDKIYKIFENFIAWFENNFFFHFGTTKINEELKSKKETFATKWK